MSARVILAVFFFPNLYIVSVHYTGSSICCCLLFILRCALCFFTVMVLSGLFFFSPFFFSRCWNCVIKGCNPKHLLQPSMLDFPLMLKVKWPVMDRIHPKSNNFAISLMNNADDSKLLLSHLRLLLCTWLGWCFCPWVVRRFQTLFVCIKCLMARLALLPSDYLGLTLLSFILN